MNVHDGTTMNGRYAAASNRRDAIGEALRHPLFQTRRIKVIGIGAGASGLLMAYKLQRNFDDVDFVFYEKNPGVAGTWFENRYPGCACDNYSHTYTYSFEPKPDWSQSYAPAPEIKQYFHDFSVKYDLQKYIRLSAQVVYAAWDDEAAKWRVQIQVAGDNIIHDEADILINSGGILNAWKWPDVKGLKDYKGALVHPANWPESLDLNGKTVGLIGNGSSAVQILPAVLPQVKSITNFIRGPNWITTPFGIGAPHEFTQKEIEKFRSDPVAHLAMRKEAENFSNRLWPLWVKGSDQQKEAVDTFRGQMLKKLGNGELSKHIIPNWGLGCRRLVPGIGYLEALKHPKTSVVKESVEEITSTGVKSRSGESFDFDVLITATGFDTSFKPRFPIIGLRGKDLRDMWAIEPKGYLGIAVPELPNYFHFLGPNCPISNGPVLSAIEGQADYVCKFIKRFQTEGIRTLAPTMKAADEFMVHKDRFFKTTVWDDNCSTWYKIGDKVTAVWVGSTVHYLRAVENPRWEDWDFTYITGNRWSYLGNGYGPEDSDKDADLSWYVRNKDTSPIIGTKKVKTDGSGYSISAYDLQRLDS